jgi:hypothetical protein
MIYVDDVGEVRQEVPLKKKGIQKNENFSKI